MPNTPASRTLLPSLLLVLAVSSSSCSSSPKEPEGAPTPPAGMTDTTAENAATGPGAKKAVRKWTCSVKAADKEFKGTGTSQHEARQLAMQACTKENAVKTCQSIRCK